jgi:hypothetical protein
MAYFLQIGLLVSGGLALGSCVDRYTPNVPPTAQANLVVDGFINAQGVSIIKLARTFSINTKNAGPAEAKAQVAIQDEAGTRYPLVENPAGTYTSVANALTPNRQYQLRITTTQGREYASDLTPALPTPSLDSLTWRLTPEQGIQVYLTTHDVATAARYYRWEYDETYQFTSAFESALEYDARRNFVRSRGLSILQGNSAQLAQNVLLNFPLLAVLPSIKLRYGYSLLVRQVAETQAEYEYWERLRKSTENLGTVNDPLPSRVTGNVHALADAAEPVLGYVGVHAVAEKRLFVNANQLPKPQPGSVFFDPAYANCLQTDSYRFPLGLPELKAGLVVALKPIINDFTGDTIGATVGTPNCVDCRLRGTNIKPSYWP